MILDNPQKIKELDKENVYGSIESLSKQCLHAWEEAGKVEVPVSYKNINKIVMCGMGGSGLGARVIDSLFSDHLKYPLTQIHDYDIPDWVDERTLVICSSYSGETEETVNNLNQALAKSAKTMCIGAGGSLIKKAEEINLPYYKIDPKYNPSKQPRLAIGYSIVGQLVLALKAGVLALSEDDIRKSVGVMEETLKKNAIEVDESDNEAKQTAKILEGKQIVFVTADHMVGAVHTVKNQFNENSKTFTSIFSIPELNHHQMEGLSHPDVNKKDLIYFFVNSDNFSEKTRKRIHLTIDVVDQNGINTVEWKAFSKEKYSEAFEFLQFGGLTNFYLAILYGINPAPIPWVDYFKEKLGQPLGEFK